MGLNDRKMKILAAIIKDYIATAEPIASRTIAKKYDFGLSSATIRNEMSDLEEMGYVVAPHASSGRIPSDKGYRLYVDQVMKKRKLSQEQQALIVQALQQEMGRMETMMQEMARAIALVTNYTTIATQQTAKRHIIKHIQLVPVEGAVVAMVIVTAENQVRNCTVVLPVTASPTLVSKVSKVLSGALAGATVEDLGNVMYISMMRHQFGQAGLDTAMVEPLINAIYSAMGIDEPQQVHTIGIKNILEYPEFADLDKARALMGVLEEKDELLALVAPSGGDKIQITIGAENNELVLQDCSIIRAKISIDQQFYGNIAIIGPTRMDYAQVMSALQTALTALGLK
ncbi:MAG: heat-inducible transcriptional repressor HrcA [Defluviitaleaceae bacterium]|nr:heat-inducible transcriptional repressor HrcA [Defluviitaleaceae bacterium]